MAHYTTEEALNELDDIGLGLVKKVQDYLKAGDVVNATKGLVALRREMYKLDEDARKLRLSGQLESEVYRTLSVGYRQIAKMVFEAASDYERNDEVTKLYPVLRFSRDVPSLSEYLHEMVE